MGQAAAQALARAGHAVRQTDRVPISGQSHPQDFHQGELTDPAFVRPLLDGIDTIVHLAPLTLSATMSPDAPGELLDAAARGTHVLYTAALAAGITRAVQASTLTVMDAYDPEFDVDESWRPRPAPVPEQLAPYLAELSAREFTRDVALETHLTAICLRFDTPDTSAGPPAGTPTGTPTHRGLSLEDASQALLGAVETIQSNPRQRGHRWHVLHIAPLTPEARYPSDLARRVIGYTSTSR